MVLEENLSTAMARLGNRVKRVGVAIGIISNQERQILISRRLPGKILAGYWEFPGGKIEPGEASEAALIRELDEELGITVHSVNSLFQIHYDYPEKQVQLDVWQVGAYTGIPMSCEGQTIQWASMDELNDFKFLPANAQIIAELKKL